MRLHHLTLVLIGLVFAIGLLGANAPAFAAPAAPAAVGTPAAATLPPGPKAPPSGAAMAQTCAGCHGTDGRLHAAAFMPLAGMPKAQLAQAMRDFRDGKRPSTLMGHVAQGFSNGEIDAMASYFAAVKPE
ncbi:putative cytochrome c subunit of the sulfide dehydrogenase FccA [Thiomonas arsenitoxydans]|jgi:sulfide dehydrogenase cytochrome subunit|uniref:Cytochrome c subunit of the sulfide dehydrogenase FccA n=1 Tax=Thiomonas arsenitoxydans (strain DSM 22701 / CIP 110005 / 3As) TaxID=426114 RepID=D6CUR8_THIA3|nr:c-type cytochrome [Thiomonas arsenitoxydans]CAZ89037.1 putative cytochrome c subunit of the sulfide dehydrogenase FccA [Thiomonas arsenitoxydans]CQR36290.1 putative cytochrome c subunit of the sulfide dehydrogenase FccA [Thiomonas arsenitoxydans]CQR36369.1 putative cytochrome c subunit of the sulfide dehydrogenase FccA [Thiomonas arsenitoxydans]CQR37571.1 putative cytochrome c subunit of the sulfide dehydrogenase FccA [Thiomonas arsenitoxydans]CQR39054.1 putative cytochrome c subunit of the